MPRLAIALPVLAVLGGPLASAAFAQSIAVDEFRPAIDARGYMTLNASQTLGHGEMSFGLGSLEWGHKLLSTNDDNMVSATLVGALGLRLGGVPLQLGVALPFTIVDGAQQLSGQGVGDLGLHLKTRIARVGRFGLGVIASVYVPTGSTRDPFLGEAATTPQLMGVADATFGRLRVAINGGIRVRRETTVMDMTTATNLPVGVGAAYALAPERLELIGEVFGSVSMGAQRGYQSGWERVGLEALAGIKVYLAKNSYMTLGAGRGLMTEQAGNPDFRGVIGIVFEPKPASRMAGHVPDERVAYVPPASKTDDGPGDRDNDGIFDYDDKCPDVMEDYDGVDDADGCPEDEDTPRDLVIEKEAELVTLRPIEFEFDKDVLRQSAYPILDAVVRALSDNPDIARVEVQGHTDEQGNDAYNLDLSNRRAETVKRYLIEQGIAAARLTSKGYGERDPIDSSHTQAAYTINRRVAFIIQRR